MLEPDNYKNTQSVPSESIAREKLMHLNSMQSRQLLALLDGFLTVFSERSGVCTLVQFTVELSIDHSIVQRAPPQCDNQSTVRWPCSYNEPIVYRPVAPAVIAPTTDDARRKSDLR